MAAQNEELLADLKREVRAYGIVDDQIRNLNQQLHVLREERRLIEDRIVPIISQPMLAGVSCIKNSTDGSNLKIKRPMTHSGSWSLTKGDLHDLLVNHLGEVPGDACFNFVVEQTRTRLVKNTYSIERTI